MSDPSNPPVATEIRDFYGRRYRVGESDRDLLGRSRASMLWAAWGAMLMAGVGQYGYGALMPVLGSTHGWNLAASGWVLAVWILCQSAAVYPAARLRGTIRVRPATTLIIGMLLCVTGLLTLGWSSSLAVVLVNHGVLGGIGAGLIYGTCLGVVANWYPERPGATALVSGAFAYGAIPFILVAGWYAAPGDLAVFLGMAAVAIVVLIGAAAAVLRDPPEYWWPAHLDPKVWSVDKAVNPGLRHNPPAIRRYSPTEVLRCPTASLLLLAVTCATAVILFNIAYLAVFATTSGWGQDFAVSALALLAAASGISRSAAGRAGEAFGRRHVARLALYGGAAAQLTLLLAGEYRLPGLLLVGAVLAGAAAGTCIALLPGLVEGYFGERPGMPNFGVFYGAKAVGGMIGVALAGHVVGAGGFSPAFLVAAAVSLTGAGLVRLLRQPGRPRLGLPGVAQPALRR